MNRKTFIIVMLIPMIAILAFIGYNYYTYSTGKEILLKTAPVDPWDLFRGDYVNLRYEISTINLSRIPYEGEFVEGADVYAVLSPGEKFWFATRAEKNKPALQKNEVCMKGKVMGSGNPLRVEYGIESYFVPEGKGRDIEMNIRDVSVKVSVDSNCRAIIKELYIKDEPVKFD